MLCGFSPGDTPGVGTFYDFCNRILDGPRPRVPGYSPPSRRYAHNRGRFRRDLKAEKEAAKAAAQASLAASSSTPTRAAVDNALATITEPVAKDFLSRINDILMTCGVVPSAADGLLGDLRSLLLAGDGTAAESGAAPNGKTNCDCRSRGIYRCDCPRIYSDPTARWGYDSHEKRFFLGHRLHAIATHHDHRDLPLFLSIDTANSADVIMGTRDLVRLYKTLKVHLPGAAFGKATFDAGYDALAFHELVVELGACPVIALNDRNYQPTDDQGTARDPDGTPLCPGGARMRFHGYNKRRKKAVFNCPAKRPGRKHGKPCFKTHLDACPNANLCEPDTVMGPLVSIATGDDPRLNPPMPRGSRQFKQAYAHRTSSERFFSYTNCKGKLNRRPYRRQHLLLINALTHALHLHARARSLHHHGDVVPTTRDGLLVPSDN